MITLFFAENCPWCYWSSLAWRDYARWGEWAWVGRVDSPLQGPERVRVSRASLTPVRGLEQRDTA